MLWAKKVEYDNQGWVPVLSSAIIDNNEHVLIAAQNSYPSRGSLLKADTSGNAIWDLRFDFPISDVVLTSDSNYAVIGRKAIAVFGQNAQIQFYKISPAGSVIFGYEYFKTSGIVNYNNVDKNTYGLLQYPDGNYFALVNVNEEIMVMKIDPNGQLVWNITYLQSVFDSYYVLNPAKWKMHLMPDNNILICGRIGNMFSKEFICFKINSNGSVLWSKKYSTTVFKISQVNATLNADSTICLFLGLADSSESIRDHAILKIDQSGNLLDTFSLRMPLKPFYPMWFGQDPSNRYNFIQLTGNDTTGYDSIQVTVMDWLFYSPCVTDTLAALTVQNFTVSVLDSFWLVTQASSTIPVLDTLVITSQNFNNADDCSPTGITTMNIANDDLKIYPNPAETFINIDFNFTDNKIIWLQIINPFGEIIYFETIKNNETKDSRKINVQRFAAGIYFARIQTDDKVITKKIMIQ